MAFQKEDGAIAAVKSALSLMDKHLTNQTYLVGHHVTLADIISFSNLVIGFKQATISFEAQGAAVRPLLAPGAYKWPK